MSTPSRINPTGATVDRYLGPAVRVELGGISLEDSVPFLEVNASRSEPAASCVLAISDPARELGGKLRIDDPVIIEWGYKGQELASIFDGLVRDVCRREQTLVVEALDRMKLLADKRLTITYQDETPTTIIRNMLAEAGIDDADLEEISEPLDRLPLNENTVVEAIQFLNRRTGLDHAFWFDPEGKFHWKPRDEEQDPAFSFKHGENVIRFDHRPGGVSVLETIGLPLWHSTVVEVTAADNAVIQFFVERVKHRLGPESRGSRTTLCLSEVGDA